MISVHEVKKLTKKFSVLYVEDEELVRQSMEQLLANYFDEVTTAANGQEALEVFQKKPHDIIITDIQMPTMDGLELIGHLRKIDKDLPIIITTAFSDEEYLLQSIELKIDKYLLKPFSKEDAMEIFHKVSLALENRAKAKELDRLKTQEQINSSTSAAVHSIIDSHQNPCIVISNGEVDYVNDAFVTLCSDTCTDALKAKDILHLDLFDKREGFASQLSQIELIYVDQNRVSISVKGGRKIYRVSKKPIDIQPDIESFLYLFFDITLEEYQKVKIQNYIDMLEGYIFKRLYCNVNLLKNEHQATTNETPIKQNLQKRSMDSVEKSILHKSHSFKVSASEYVEELDGETIEALRELDKLEVDFASNVSQLIDESNYSSLKIISKILSVYSREIHMLFEFQDLGYALDTLAHLLQNLSKEDAQKQGYERLGILLQGIQSELKDWRELIFVEQSAIDIHYLDSSLFSNCLQIELLLNDSVDEVADDGEDLVFF
jgi:CheY-like chemotaxis protein